jgi:hypothetical protein
MHGNDLIGKSVVILLRAEVQFADRDDAVTRFTQMVMPARDRPIIGIGVIPKPDLMNVLAGCECRARRNANR